MAKANPTKRCVTRRARLHRLVIASGKIAPTAVTTWPTRRSKSGKHEPVPNLERTML